MSKTMSTDYFCICEQAHKTKSKLRKHVNICKYAQNLDGQCLVNPIKKDLLQLAVSNSKIISVDDDENQKTRNRFSCGCQKSFMSKGGYYRHIKKCIQRPEHQAVSGKTKCNESGCLLTFKYIKDLRQHLKEKHKMQFDVEDKTFNRYSDFKRWKEIYEAETFSCFYHRKTEIRCGRRVEYWYCNRSGIYNSVSQGRRRKLKSQGILKINNNCTSSITLTINETEGNVQAIIYHTHYGHEAELVHLRISKSDKQEIASKLLQGVQIDDILSSYKEFGSNKLTERKHLIKRRDILNISKKYNVNIILPKIQQSSKKIKKKKDNPQITTKMCMNKDLPFNIIESKKRHYIASQLPLSAISSICNSSWKIYFGNNLVPSYSLSAEEVYQVTKNIAICEGDNCKLYCNCSICYHSYLCTCSDFVSRNIICEHIHLVVIFQGTPQTLYDGCVEKPLSSHLDHTYHNNFSKESTNLIQQIKSGDFVEDFPEHNAQSLKIIKLRLEKLMLDTLQEISKCNNAELLENIEKQINNISKSYFEHRSIIKVKTITKQTAI